MRLSRLARHLEEFCERIPTTGPDPELRRLRLDSRRVGPGDLFAALPGHARDGREFLPEARERGAAAVLSPGFARDPGLPQLVLRPGASPRRAAGRAAALLAGSPAERLWVGAVTGTNGKTTVVHLATEALAALGRRPARAGTLGLAFGGRVEPTPNTTPDPDRLQDWLATAVAAGADSLLLEASSHALDQDRLAGLRPAAAAWTNLARDHLDYHSDLEAYAAAKARLIHGLAPGDPALVPAGDERISAACRGAAAELLPWSLDGAGAVRGRLLACGGSGLRLAVAGELGEAELVSPLVGRHNAENLLVAFGLLRLAGVGAAPAAGALARVGPAPGRLERVAPDSPWFLYVDYAHTPDALARALEALRRIHPGRRLGVVFGAGGDRDRGKRPLMGAAAAHGADWCLITSDNPRSEDPEAILAEVAAGAPDAEREPDRRRAIRRALAGMAPGEVLLVAGKGHEDYQEIRGRRLPFDDRVELMEAVRCSD
ncbi:MAG: UDP-N-acetylmuramoyl-L-alanyl-D-glutamate--2,6-diaminopimelate ligase [Planctomycetota bacterium]|nr:MAG: UDP-N-acetylmuramoyl-L-alanyl-D-glutamate--2,6-diaminopimelate ligase [Planctomycetota bacterium]